MLSLRISSILRSMRFVVPLGVMLAGCGGTSEPARPLETVPADTVRTDGQAKPVDAVENPQESGGVAEPHSSLLKLKCLDGRVVEPFTDPATKAVVLVFIATDCPIANAYHPCLAQLHQDYIRAGVSFFLVHSSSRTTIADAQAHADEYGLASPVILDSDQSIAKRCSAEVTPEAVVWQRELNAPVYRGAISNLYAGYGEKRPVATEQYLRNALDEVLAGKPISVPTTKPIGCFISFDK